MFFTNGGASGGAPVWLLLGMIYIALILDGRLKYIMLVLNMAILTACWIVGYRFPSLVTEYSRGGNYFDAIAAIFIVGMIIYMLISFQMALSRREEEDKNLKRLFEQTASALVNAIDAKDRYTHGHSSRVAEYSRRMAELSGKSSAECEEIYYVALLHDVGKIGIPESIINKEGKLTDEEYEIIKQHPVLGAQILNSITEYPGLMVGARHHHERYDGKGYPDRLKGEDIPEIARIISVADAYDAMTSKRSYRKTIPQQSVREEIVKGAGTQFDPKYAKMMQHLIDLDTEYEMKEKATLSELSWKNDLISKKNRDEISDGILLGQETKTIRFKCEAAESAGSGFRFCMILFDSLDGRYHDSPRNVSELNYFEYAVLWADGEYECEGARKVAAEGTGIGQADTFARRRSTVYEIEAVRVKDHVQIKINDTLRSSYYSFTIALPDNTRYSYLGLTGENCHLSYMSISTAEEAVPNDYITRIAEEISYIDGPEGDLPNVQIDGYRSDSTIGVPLRDGMKITFHTKSLPMARLVWHCAYIDLFWSPGRKPLGDGYLEYALIRLDGENWEAERVARNKLIVNLGDEFTGWDAWKEANKIGYDCTVYFKIDGDRIITTTNNLGIGVRSTTTVLEMPEEMYVCLTGDQCAITNIRIHYADMSPAAAINPATAVTPEIGTSSESDMGHEVYV
ncbi:MAG: HD-GYP domain-containing protein [Lachnospiraceae bacterium]|nr:HD-GYP domain-containing protein [Lachnospiraceae bacterium]